MTLDDFSNGPAQSDILSESDRLDLFLYYSAENKPALHFLDQPRASKFCCSPYSSKSRELERTESSSTESFSVNRKIAISGFELYGGSEPNSYSVTVELSEKDGETLVDIRQEVEDTGCGVVKVDFGRTIEINPGRTYTVSIACKNYALPHIPTFKGEEIKPKVTIQLSEGAVTFKFGNQADGAIAQFFIHPLMPVPNSPPIVKQENSGKEDWRLVKRSISERFGHIFNRELYSDVTFVVGAQCSSGKSFKVKAHKLVLALASRKFHRMFYGEEQQQELIEVPNVKPGAFVAFMKHIYTDLVDINLQNVLSVLYSSAKYNITHLSESCVEFLSSNLTAKNACELLSEALRFDDEETTSRLLEVIGISGEDVLKSNYFTSLEHAAVKGVLGIDTLVCNELAAFDALERWARAECLRKGLDENSMTAEDKRRAIGEALYLVRFPTLTLEQFANGPAQSEILTKSDKINLFVQYRAKVKPTIRFSSKPRVERSRCTRYFAQARLHKTKELNSIKFTVDRKIAVAGYTLYGPCGGSASFNVQARLERVRGNSQYLLTQVENTVKPSKFDDKFDLLFNKLVIIHPGKWYIASAMVNSDQLTYYGTKGRREITVKCCDGPVKFQFENSTLGARSLTTVEQGQLPGILFYLVA